VSLTLITPTYNRDWTTVKRCIECVDAQRWDVFHLICADGPDPALAEAVKPYCSARRLYLELPRHSGDFGNSPRVACLKLTTTDYVGFLDDDNVISTEYCSTMVTALEQASDDVGFAICRIVHLGPLPLWQGATPKILTGVPVQVGNIDTLQVVMKRSAILEVGWQSHRGYYADGYTYEEMARRFRFIEVPTLLGWHL
jgi:glycosyltransferase involved in cell wall biosynthesis